MKKAIVFYDIILFFLSTMLYGGALTVSINLGYFIFNNIPWFLFFFSIPLLIIIFLLTLIFEIWFIQILLPEIKEGYYNAPNSSVFYIWTVHLTLNRLLFFDPLKNLILYSANLRYFAFRALGGKVAYESSISANTTFVDLPMYEVGKETVIGAWTHITGHFINKDKINFGKIIIGNKVNIGAYCHIAPGVHIGDNSWIGTECRISPLVYIGKNCSIEPLSIIPPGTRIEDGESFPPKND